MSEGINKTFDAAIRDFLLQAHTYKEDLEGMLDQLQSEPDFSEGATSYEERVEALEGAIELVEQAIDAVEALPD